MTDVQSHQAVVQVMLASSEIDAYADIVFKIRVSCPAGCDMRGQIVQVVAHDSVVVEAVLTEFDGTVAETGELIVESPNNPGDYAWTALFPTQEKDSIVHLESSMLFSFSVRPHTIDLTVESPAVLVMGDPFTIQVEAQCPAGCDLAGQPVEVYDQAGTLVGTAELGNDPAAGENSLAHARVVLVAPNIEKRLRWAVKVLATGLNLPHREGTGSFAFGVTKRPDHLVTLKVVDLDSGEPVEKASATLWPHVYRGSAYRGQTDAGGVVKIGVPTGRYQIYVSAGKKDYLEQSINIERDEIIPVGVKVRERFWWQP